MRFLIISLTLALIAPIHAQESSTGAWKIDGSTSLTAALNYYNDQWTGSESNSLTWAWQFAAVAERDFAAFLRSTNTLKLGFGQTSSDSTLRRFKKSSDLINFETILRGRFKGFVDPFVGAQLISQFADQRIPGSTVYVNPMELTESFGAIRDFVKTERTSLQMRIAGAVRQKIDRNDILVDSLETLESFTNDGGLELVTEFRTTNSDGWLRFTSRLQLYEALFSSSADDGSSVPAWRYPDVNFENTLSINMTKYLMLNLYGQMLYDKEIHANVRIKTVTGLGVTVAFKR